MIFSARESLNSKSLKMPVYNQAKPKINGGRSRMKKLLLALVMVFAFTGFQGLAQASDGNVFQPDDKADGVS
ncbi:hypothetical protein CHH52_09990 [Shouchella clausii]|nr:hypothetical protein CHH52_09990 [Shouchella clausii]